MHVTDGITASIVSHGQMRLANALIEDIVRHCGQHLKRLIVTVNVPEADPVRAEGAPFELVVLRNERPLGFGANHNRAFAHCDTTFFAVLNPDLHLADDALGRMLAARQPGDGVLAPVILNTDGTSADAARRVPTPLRLALRRLQRRPHAADPDFDWLAGMCLVLDSEAFGSIGGFDARYHLYCEDVDLCLRMQLAGWRLHRVAGARLTHDARRHSHRSARYLWWHVQSLLRLWTSRVLWSYLARRRQLRLLRRADPG